MHLLVGLGNPEPEYGGTRHNIGFMAADAIAGQLRCGAWKKKFSGLVTTPPGDSSVLLLKPLTYMNLSGESVGAAMRFHKMTPENIIVFHDDLDLLPGQVKIKRGGGSGGHNGLKSIDAHIGPEYWRVRLGIGHPRAVAVATAQAGAEQSRVKTGPGIKGDIVTNYVLGAFAKADRTWLEPLLEALASEIDLLLQGKTAEYLARLPSP